MIYLLLNHVTSFVKTNTYIISARDSCRDSETNSCNLSIPDTMPLCYTDNLLSKLKTCIGDRNLLTDNVNISNRLINESIGTANSIHIINQIKHLMDMIYAQFHHPQQENHLKLTDVKITKVFFLKQVGKQLLFRGNGFLLYLPM